MKCKECGEELTHMEGGFYFAHSHDCVPKKIYPDFTHTVRVQCNMHTCGFNTRKYSEYGYCTASIIDVHTGFCNQFYIESSSNCNEIGSVEANKP